MKKKLLSLLLCGAMALSLVACGGGETESTDTTTENTETTETTDTTEGGETTELSEEEAWKLEPAYGKPIRYWYSDGCTSGPAMADALGYFAEEGLTAEHAKGETYTEALGTGNAEVAVGHIATMLVPSTNGVDLTFVGGAHVGCKSLYVLADSPYQTTEDLKGTKVSVPNGIGASDYNITACLFDSDGINPLEEVELVQVETSACVASMQNGEISAALLSDTFAYNLVKDGTLRCVRSLLNEDWAQRPCCVIAMNATFVKENPITAKKVATAVKKAHIWMNNNPEEATQMLIDMGLNSEDLEMNTMLNSAIHFGLEDNFSEEGLRYIAEHYIKLGIITSTQDVEEVMAKAWTPIAPEIDAECDMTINAYDPNSAKAE